MERLIDSEKLEAKWTAEEEKRVRNKLDWHIVPLMTLLVRSISWIWNPT
jgi:hypothetical protein